jgi:hypothetical protein
MFWYAAYRRTGCIAALVGAVAVAGCGSSTRVGTGRAELVSAPVAGVSGVYQIGQARRAAQHLLSVMRLPPGARRSRTEPAGGGVSLASYAVNVPSAPHLVDLHEFFVVKRSTAADVIGWMEAHRPAGSEQSDSGSNGSAGGDWTSFEFRHGRDLAVSDLVANAVSLRGGGVAVRVDAQTAPTPRLPSGGTGPGMLRVIQSGGMFGSFAYTLRCDPTGGSVPDPRRICSAIAADRFCTASPVLITHARRVKAQRH